MSQLEPPGPTRDLSFSVPAPPAFALAPVVIDQTAAVAGRPHPAWSARSLPRTLAAMTRGLELGWSSNSPAPAAGHHGRGQDHHREEST